MKSKIMILMLLALFSLSSCHEDEVLDGYPVEKWSVSLVAVDNDSHHDPSLLSCYASYESVTVSISGLTAATRSVVITSDADWLTLRRDTLASDNIITFTTTDNQTDQRRTATLTFADADHPELTGTLMLSQRSAADQDTNGDDARANLYVGYGYNIYAALESPMAVRTTAPIINMKIVRQDQDNSLYQLVQDCHLLYTRMNTTVSNTIKAFGADLSQRQTGDREHTFQGCTQDCQTAVDLVEGDAKGQLNQQNFGQGSIEKAVASRIMDRATITWLRDSNKLHYSNDFLFCIDNIRNKMKQGSDCSALVAETLRRFGTHLVTQVDLGGRIDYIFTMSKTNQFNTKEEMEEEIKYTLGQMTDSERSGLDRHTTSSKTAEGAIKIHGGSQSARAQLEEDLRDTLFHGQINPDHLNDWMATINYSDRLTLDTDLDVIHFELMPLWDVVPKDLRQIFLDETMRMVQDSDCQLPASVVGTDIYEFDIDQWPSLFDFSQATADSSLCRLLYLDYNPKSNEGIGSAIEAASGDPVLQVCSEYVPNIRTDQRVTIVYPIFEQNIRMNQGLFLGDGIHQPAIVGFKGGKCYVNPIDTLPTGYCIKRFWYVNGNLSLKNPTGVKGLKGKNPIVRDDCFYYTFNYLYKYPIVKIGANFWTRRNVDNDMGFTSDPNSRRNRADEHLVDNVLYARFYYDVGYYQNKDNGWLWGEERNTFFADKPNMKWYIPQSSEVEGLYAFLGFNPKALFKGQQSGFDAQFHGYYGVHDLLNDVGFGTNNALRYRNEYMFLASRTTKYGQAVVMLLDPDYHLRLKEAVGDWSNDYFPLRPVRGWMFTYPKLSEIIKNTNL